MRNRIRLIYTAAVQFALLIAAAQAIDAQVYGGRATAITASTTISGSTNNYVSTDTGQLPATGGDANASSPSYLINGLLATGVLTASTSGALKSSQSFAVVNDFVFVLNGVTVQADRITVRTGCICCPEADLGNCSGSTQISGLVVTDASGNQTNVTVTGQVGQQVALPGGLGTIFINEQSSTSGGISVNGIRIAASSGGSTYSVVGGNAQSTLQCLTTGPTAGPAIVQGRVLDRQGRGISGARVSLSDENGNTRSTLSNSTGNYAFAEVPSGKSYILSVTHKTYSFSPKAIVVNEDMTVNITAN